MMKIKGYVLGLTLILLGCGESNVEKETTTDDPQAKTEAHSEEGKQDNKHLKDPSKRTNPLQGHLDALNKAKQVEAKLKEAEKKRRKQMEDQGG